MTNRVLFFVGGVIGGALLALLIGWVLFPMPEYEPSPSAMRRDYKYEYIRLVAVAYSVEGDRAQAESRLRAISPDAPAKPLVALTERWIEDGRTGDLIAPLAQLAYDMGAATPAMEPYLDRGEG